MTWMVIALAACGDDGGERNTTPDAPEVLRYPVGFEVRGDTPLLVAFADNDGTWSAVPTSADNKYSIQATNKHAIAMVCGSASYGYRTQIELRTRFDSAPFFFCFNGDDVPIQTFSVTGEMMQPGEVQMGARAEGTTAPWMFDLTVSSGPHDLVAFGANMALVRRDISVDAATTVPAIDLAQGGAAYATTPVILGNTMTDETIETISSVFTGNDIADYVRPGTTVYALPSSLLDVIDFQFSEIRASTATTRRTAPIEEGAASAMITLMPRLSGIVFTETGAMWSALPESTAELRLSSGSANNTQTIHASGGYIDGDKEISVTLDIPGFDDAWRITAATAKSFTAYDDENLDTTFLQGATSARQLEPRSRPLLTDRALRVQSAAAAAARARR